MPRSTLRRPRPAFFAAAAVLGALLALPGAVAAQGAERTLVVGTKQAPPFAIRHDDGTWSGISIELWRGLAADLGVTYELRELDLPGLLAGLADGSLDVGAAALTLSEEREVAFDFSHPFYSSGLGIAVAPTASWLGAAASLLSPDFLRALLILLAVLALAGLAVWLFERRANDEEFGGSPARGLGSAFWWSAVTMTTVGYGDKAPRTFAGRFIAIIWMFAGVFMISAFTASIASVLTTAQLRSDVAGPDDLPSVRVGTVADSTSEAYLNRRNIGARAYPTTLDALRALAGRDVDAVVYDAPILQYLAINDLPGRVRVLPARFEAQQYGFAFPSGSPLREQVNRLILERTGDAQWRASLKRYLGE